MWLTVTSSFGACPISFTRSDDLFPSLELHFERVICKLRGAKNLTTKVLPSLHSRLSKPFMSFVNHGKLDAKTCWMHIWSSWWSGIPLASLWKPQQERSGNLSQDASGYSQASNFLSTESTVATQASIFCSRRTHLDFCKLATQTAKQTCLKHGRNKSKTGVSQI